MKHAIFKGAATAIITPMDGAGNVDFRSLKRLLDFQIENGIDAIVVTGTTGESSTLEDWEKIAVAEFVIKYVDHRVPVIVGTGSNDTSHAVFLSKEAENLDADGLLLVTPYYNKTSQRGLIRHFTEIADSVNIPAILYNVPTRTGVSINPETYLELSKHPNICGIKEASGNLSHIAKVAALCGDELSLYSGNDDQIVPILSLGGEGVISVLGNIMPRETHEICRFYFDGEVKMSSGLQLELLDLMNALFSDVNPIPVKAALEMMGICKGNLRLPLVEMEEGSRAKLKRIMEDHGLLAK